MALLEINRQLGARELRRFAGLYLPLFVLVVGLVLRYRFELPVAAIGVWLVGGVLALGGVIWPPFARALYLGISYAGYPIGWLVSHTVLVLLFFAVITPIGIVLRLAGRDPLIKRATGAASYWRRRTGVTDPDRYFRQS